MTERACSSVLAAVAISFAAALFGAPLAYADVGAYLVNVTVQPGYNFADATQAINYGNKICGEVDHGRTYSQIVAGIKADFGTEDQHKASYLIAQAINELCPALVWHLRRSAAGDDVANSARGDR